MNERTTDTTKILLNMAIGSSMSIADIPESGGYCYWGMRECEIKNEKLVAEEGGLVTVKINDWVQTLTLDRLLGLISYAMPYQHRDIVRIGERAFEFINYQHNPPPRRSSLERLQTNNWFN